MLANGHPQVYQYPLCRVWTEADMIVRRVNAVIAKEATMMQTVISSVISGKNTVLNKQLKELTGG